MMTVTKEAMQQLYTMAGTKVNPEIKFVYDQHIPLTDGNKKIICDAIRSLGFGFMPSEFQVNTLNAMLTRTDALVLAPTGQGKSLIYEAGIVVRRMKNPKSVLLLCLPLTSVMEAKSKKPVLPTAFITMAGKIVVNDEGEEVEDAEVPADLMESVLEGDYAIIMGHAESFLSPTGRRLLKSLKKKKMIAIVCIDELHKFLRWKMRPSMQVSKNMSSFHSLEYRRCHQCSGRWARRRGASTSPPPSPRPTSRWPRSFSA
jgi:hypothetical protein